MKKLMWLTMASIACLGFGSAIFAALEWFDVNVSGGYVGRDGSVDWRFVGCVDHTTDGGACKEFNQNLYATGSTSLTDDPSADSVTLHGPNSLVDAGYRYFCDDGGAPDGCYDLAKLYTFSDSLVFDRTIISTSPCENPEKYFRQYPGDKEMIFALERCGTGITLENAYNPKLPLVIDIPRKSFGDVILRLDGKEYRPCGAAVCAVKDGGR